MRTLFIDGSGNIFVAGNTEGSLGETNGGGSDVFVLKMDASGALDTTFGGGDGITQFGNTTIGDPNDDGEDHLRGLYADDSGNIFISGHTNGSLGEANGGGYDAFIAKLDSSGALNTSFGGGDGILQFGNATIGGTADDGNEYVRGIYVDDTGNIFMAGHTNGSLGETNGGLYDVFVIKLNSTGVLDGSFGGGDGITQLGNVTVGGIADDGNDSLSELVVDNSGNIFVTGITSGSLGETNGGGDDTFVVKLDSTGALDTSFGDGDGIAQLGDVTVGGTADDGNDSAQKLVIDETGNIFVAGDTTGSLGEASGGGYDAFVVKLDSNGELSF